MTEEELKAQEAEAAKKAEEEAAAKAAADEEAKKKERENEFSSLPAWAQEEIRSTRREAATFRTTAKALEAKGADDAAKLAAAETLLAEHKAAQERAELVEAFAAQGLPAEAVDAFRADASPAERAAAAAAITGGPRRQVIIDGALHASRTANAAPATNGGDLMRDLVKSRR